MSICAGAFVLAACGLLDGRRATTHWRLCAELAERYPDVDVVPNVLFTHDGAVMTSAGSAAGVDLGLHIIETDHGPGVAAEVARRLVVQPRRHGDQAQFVPARFPPVEPGRIAESMQWATLHLTDTITVAAMATSVHMSERHYSRCFRSETGLTPMAWLLDERLHLAKRLLEGTPLSMSEIAARSGLGTDESLRHHFRRRFQLSPSTYRRSFSVGDR